MTLTSWLTRSASLSNLREEANNTGYWEWGIFGWLQNIGVVPWEVQSMPAARVRLNIDPEEIPVGYLAATAYEWDSWGQSHPDDFIDMLEAELKPEKRDFIAAILTSLGRSVQ